MSAAGGEMPISPSAKRNLVRNQRTTKCIHAWLRPKHNLAILMKAIADLILKNGRITTLDRRHPEANEVVIVGDKFAGVDNAAELSRSL